MVDQTMRVVFVTSPLAAGGAERVLSTISNYWAARGWKIVILVLGDYQEPFYPLDPRVSVTYLALPKYRRARLRYLPRIITFFRSFRRLIIEEHPHCVVSFLVVNNIQTLLACTGLGLPVVVSERIYPPLLRLNWKWRILRSLTYPYADAVVVQTNRARNFFRFPTKKKTVVIPNPIDVRAPLIAKSASASVRKKIVIATLGRLHPQKGHDLLLQAFAKVASHHDCELLVVGEGPQRKDLETLRDHLGLQSRVSFPGILKDPWGLLKSADIFVLSSRLEGFPNALLEAMAMGLPVISTDCPAGPREIIRHDHDGILVQPEDINGLAMAIEDLIQHPEKRMLLGANAVEVTERFALNKVMGMWEQVFLDCVDGSLQTKSP